VRSALDALDRYVELFRRGTDELFYLYGLAYEQDTPFRDIKKAHENYQRVRDEYPRSPRWRAAAERVAYLERHFYGLR
jgi:outer membrane protein assembly factor BamD (BamD/ComL family)